MGRDFFKNRIEAEAAPVETEGEGGGPETVDGDEPQTEQPDREANKETKARARSLTNFLEKFYADSGDLSEAVLMSKLWYLGQNRRLTLIAFFLVLALTVSLAGNAVQYLTRPRPVYFAATSDLRILEMPPLSEPVFEDQVIMNWSIQSLTSTLSLNFLHIRENLMRAREYFDSDGFKSFVSSLEKSGNLEKIRQERLSLSCVATEAPVITAKGLRADVMTWKIEVPITLSYESSKGVVATQKLLASLTVERADTRVHPRGLVISQVILARK